MKSAMVRMAARLPEHNARLILQIHDEVVVCSYQSSFLVFSSQVKPCFAQVEAPVHETDAVSLIVKECMENPFSSDMLGVPIPVKLFAIFLSCFFLFLLMCFSTGRLDSHWVHFKKLPALVPSQLTLMKTLSLAMVILTTRCKDGIVDWLIGQCVECTKKKDD